MTKKIIIFSVVFFGLMGFSSVSHAANQISKVDFENNLTDSLGYVHAYEYWYMHPSNPDHIVTYVPGHTGLAAWSTHNLDDGGGDLAMAFPSKPITSTNELYIKYWIKFDANYSNCVGNTYYNTKQLWFDGGSLGHTEVAFTSFSDTGVGLVWQGGSGTPTGSDWFGASYTRGDWMKIEMYMKLSSGVSHTNPDGHFVMAINNKIVSDRNNIITGYYDSGGLDRTQALKATCACEAGHGGWALDDYEVWDGLPSFASMSSSVSTTPPPPTCTESWSCTLWSAWSTCTNNFQSQTRTCTDTNSCGTTTSKPTTTQTQACISSQTGDTTPPDLWSRTPVPDAANISHTNRSVSMHIGDGSLYGANPATIKLNVNGQDYCCASGSCNNKILSCAGSPSDYLVTYTHSNDWSSGQTVNLTADASDSATPPNAMTQRAWSFTVENYTTATTYNLTNFTQLATDWLKTISSPADANKDGKVNSQDLGIMMSNWK